MRILTQATSWLAVSLLALLVGCAGPVPKIDAKADKLAPIHTIAVIPSPEPKVYTVMNFGHPGMAFGLVGGIVAAADMNSKQEQLAAAYHSKGADISSALAKAVAQQLVDAGYEAQIESGPWEEADGKLKIAFEKIKSDADAVLVLSPTIIGFVNTGLTIDYMPTITTVVYLLGSDRKEPIYRGYHASGFAPKADGWRTHAPIVTYSSFDSIVNDPTVSIQALERAAGDVAVGVAADLRRGDGVLSKRADSAVANVSKPAAPPPSASLTRPSAQTGEDASRASAVAPVQAMAKSQDLAGSSAQAVTAQPPPDQQAPRSLLQRGDALEYRLVDRLTGTSTTVIYRVDRIEGDRFVFNQGARVEDSAGELVSLSSAIGGLFDADSPPKGWGRRDLKPGMRWKEEYTSTTPDRFRHELDAVVLGTSSVQVEGKDIPVTQIEYVGWIYGNADIGSNASRLAIPFKASAWYSADLGHVVRFDAQLGRRGAPTRELLELNRILR